jgi:hypothetical protein
MGLGEETGGYGGGESGDAAAVGLRGIVGGAVGAGGAWPRLFDAATISSARAATSQATVASYRAFAAASFAVAASGSAKRCRSLRSSSSQHSLIYSRAWSLSTCSSDITNNESAAWSYKTCAFAKLATAISAVTRCWTLTPCFCARRCRCSSFALLLPWNRPLLPGIAVQGRVGAGGTGASSSLWSPSTVGSTLSSSTCVEVTERRRCSSMTLASNGVLCVCSAGVST